jgi:hypothetical protein
MQIAMQQMLERRSLMFSGSFRLVARVVGCFLALPCIELSSSTWSLSLRLGCLALIGLAYAPPLWYKR